MKKIFAIAAMLACAVLSAQEEVDRAVVAPGGVRIEAQRVYVTAAKDETRGEGDWRDSEMAYSHGNATLRFRLENTNETAQTIHAQFPLETGDGSLLGWGRTITLAAGKEVGGGETVEWDVPVPMVGSISFGPSADPAQQPRIADSSGESAGTSMLRCFGYNVYEIILKNLYSPSGRVVADDAVRGDRPVVRLAVSPAARRFDFAEAYARVAKARSAVANSQDGERMVLEAPDFTRFRRWQDMSVYDMIAIDEDDWAHYPNNLKKLFPDWVAGGGTLAFIGTDESPIAPGNYGLGKVVALGASSPDLDALFKTLATTMIRYSLATSPFDCDIKASDAVGALRNETPFSTILLVLLAFSVLAGPVLVVTLARHNKRLVLFWLFPALAVAFSLGVMGVIICSHGIDPELRQFVHTIYDEKAGKVVTICNHVIIAPFTLQGDIRLDAQDSVVSYMSGDVGRCGETILYTGREFVFRDGWAPTLWPVVFRTVTVRDLSDAKDAPPVPVSGRLQEHYVSATEERRVAK